MQWWTWIVIGVLLLGAELLFVDAQFYVVFLGVSALIVGSLDPLGITLPAWQQWLLFAALSLVTTFSFRKRIYYFIRPAIADIPIGPAGDTIVLSAALAPGARCRIEYRGTQWDALNEGQETISAGSSAKILRVEGLTLKVSAS